MSALTTDRPRRHELEKVVALGEGVPLIETDQRTVFANAAALAMHGVDAVAGLGATVDECREAFALTCRNNHPVRSGEDPIERVLAGEAFDEVVVRVQARHDPRKSRVHRIRSLVITDDADQLDLLVPVVAEAADHRPATVARPKQARPDKEADNKARAALDTSATKRRGGSTK